MKSKLKKRIILVCTLVIGMIISEVGVYVASAAISSSQISYSNTNSKLTATTLQGAIDELNTKATTKIAEAKAECPTGQSCYKTYNVGDVFTVANTEQFYVIEDLGYKVKGLAMYNVDIAESANKKDGDNKQDPDVLGWVSSSSGKITYGTIAFSSTNYWNNSSATLLYPADIYQPNSINNYASYYAKRYVSSLSSTAKASLLTYDEAVKLGCSDSSCKNGVALEWVYSTSYWLGSAYGTDRVWSVGSGALFEGRSFGGDYSFGVRPVIEISKSEIN